MQYSLDKQTWSDSIPTGTNPGSYTVWYKVVGDGNRNDTEAQSVNVTIAQKEVNEPTACGSYIYNGQNQMVTLDGYVSSYMSVTSNTEKNAGIHTVIVTLDANYKWADGSDGSVEWSIAPKTVTVTIQPKSSAYGAAIVELTATDNGIVSGDTSVYTLSTTATSSSNVGTYDITGEDTSSNYTVTCKGETKAYIIIRANYDGDTIATGSAM